MESKNKINERQLKKSSDTVRALNHDLRLSIIECIHTKGITNVHDIYTTLDLEQSVTSQQLKILRDSDFVISERKGKEISL